MGGAVSDSRPLLRHGRRGSCSDREVVHVEDAAVGEVKYAGEYLQRDMSTVSRYESGEYPLRRIDLLALLSLYGVSDEETRDDLLQICDEHWRKGWWDQHRADLGDDFINLPWLESRADRICKYQPLVIPSDQRN